MKFTGFMHSIKRMQAKYTHNCSVQIYIVKYMTLQEFYKLDAELVDYFTSDEGYRIEQHSAIIDGIYKSIFMCNGKIKII